MNPREADGTPPERTDRPEPSFVVRYRYLLLLALGLLLLVPFLGLRDMWYPDEPDIAEVCQAMFESGDWISPRRMGVIWVDYPPLIYWTGCAASHLLGGLSEFALRLPNALASIALVLLTCAAVSRWFDARTGLWAGFLLLTFQHFAYEAVNYRPDMLFSLAVAAGFYLYLHGEKAGRKPLWRIAAFAMFGVAMLAKGPLGLLLSGLILTLWHLSRREWKSFLLLAPLAGVSLAVYMPWFSACARAMGSDNILYELYAQNVARFFGGDRGHEQPVWYYFQNYWIDLAPWSLLLPFALWWIHRVRLWRDRSVQLALWWFFTYLAFLTIAVTKRQIYFLPAYPAAAILLAPWISAFWREDGEAAGIPSRRHVFIGAGIAVAVMAVIGIGLLVAVAAFPAVMEQAAPGPMEMEAARALRAPVVVSSLVLLAGMAWVALALRRRDPRAVLVRLGVAHLPLYLVVIAWLLPAMNPTKTYAPQGAWIRAEIGESERFGVVGRDYKFAFAKMGAFGYYTGAHVDLLVSRSAVKRYLAEYPGSAVLVHQMKDGEIFRGEDDPLRARMVRDDLYIGRHRYTVLRGGERPVP